MTDAEEWNEHYSAWNSSNLETEGVDYKDLESGGGILVLESHPAIGVLRYNSNLINLDLAKIPLIEGKYYRLSKQLFDNICITLQTKVLPDIEKKSAPSRPDDAPSGLVQRSHGPFQRDSDSPSY